MNTISIPREPNSISIHFLAEHGRDKELEKAISLNPAVVKARWSDTRLKGNAHVRETSPPFL
jgi:hypothetical protein